MCTNCVDAGEMMKMNLLLRQSCFPSTVSIDHIVMVKYLLVELNVPFQNLQSPLVYLFWL